MSERMTVEEAWAEHGSIIGLARLARVNDQITAEEVLREHDRARAIVKQAILDEGLKEERARVDGLVEAVGLWIAADKAYIERGEDPDTASALSRAESRLIREHAALAAVRESQVSEGGV